MIFHKIGRARTRVRRAVVAAQVALLFLLPLAAHAQALGGVSAIVATSEGGPVSGALITLRGDAGVRSMRTDSGGTAKLADVLPGVYVVSVDAAGFNPLGGRTIDIRSGAVTNVGLVLTRSSTSLTVLGRVTTQAGESLSTSSAPSQEVNVQRAAARGAATVSDLIWQEAVSATIVRPAGGSAFAPAIVALRGSDPTETLVEIDGHSVNSGGTGAFDLSLVDPAELSGLQLVYGIAPSSLVGPNTIDGAINVRTLDPTARPEGLVRLTAGSFGTLGETLQTTGTRDALGYAISLHRTTSQGEVYAQPILTTTGETVSVGSSVSGSTGLVKTRYGFDRGEAYVGVTLRDQSAYRDLSAPLSSVAMTGPGPTVFRSFAGSALQAHSAAYGLDFQTPVGRRDAEGVHRTTLLARHFTTTSDQSVLGPAAGITPFLNNTRDLIADDSLQVDRALAHGTLSLKLETRGERLDTQTRSGGTPEQSQRRGAIAINLPASSGLQQLPALTQTQRSAVLRYMFDPTAQLHYSAAVYYSNFSSFGSSLDPRFGLVWTPNARTAVRGSTGSTFQSPQLPGLYVPPVLPPPDPQGFIDIGNPNLKADHATDYDLGLAQIFAGPHRDRVDFDLYWTNLRSPAQRYIPPVSCVPPAPPVPACESFPINAGGAIYRGIELRATHVLDDTTVAQFAYSVNSSFATSVSANFQNGNILPGEQFQSVPLHKGMLTVERVGPRDIDYRAGAVYEDGYNELNRPAFVVMNAGVTWHAGRLEIGLFGTNLTNVYDDRFTLAGRGQPYGAVAGLLPSDAFSLQGRAFSLVFTRRY